MLDLASDAAAHRRTAAAATATLEAASSASHSRGVPSKQGRTRHGFFCTFALGCSASTPFRIGQLGVRPHEKPDANYEAQAVVCYSVCCLNREGARDGSRKLS